MGGEAQNKHQGNYSFIFVAREAFRPVKRNHKEKGRMIQNLQGIGQAVVGVTFLQGRSKLGTGKT